MRILKPNLMIALQIAIETLKAEELERHGPDFKSCFRVGLEDVMAALRNNEKVTIEDG